MRFWLTMLLVLVIDQLSKLWIVHSFNPGESRAVWDQVFYLTYVQNQGAAFGMLPGRSWLFLIGALLVIVVLIIFNSRYRQPNRMQIITGLIVAGAVGNLLDRVRLNYVVDFFDLGWWPVFNIADMAIVCGAILLVIMMFRDEKGELIGRG
ncbi:signal peptidase II [Syntrophomonas curvata]